MHALNPLIPELSADEWLLQMRGIWRQGEHVALMGQTGAGKTTLARSLLSCRSYVCALAVKRNDDILDSFKRPVTVQGIAQPAYVLRVGRHAWPPEYHETHVVVWFKPKNLRDVGNQATQVYRVLDDIFRNGGWGVYIDDTGYVTGTLGLGRQITVLLNQGRSSGISVITAMTQPTSVAARVPTETLRQCRHILSFRYHNRNDLDIIGKIVGMDRQELLSTMEQLGKFDFIWFREGTATIVRQTRKE